MPAEIRDVIGSPELIHCPVMNGTSKCQNCGCDYGTHINIDYETVPFEVDVINSNIKEEIEHKGKEISKILQTEKKLRNMKTENQKSYHNALKDVSILTCYLKKNAITTYNHAYKTYIGYLIDR